MSLAAHKFPGVFTVNDGQRVSLATMAPATHKTSVYGEKLVTHETGVYRLWSPRRSKLAAAIQNGINELPIQPGSRVLYLGAASGTTVSHVSDIIGPRGLVISVEFSPSTARGLVELAATRTNIIPIVEDARYPARYAQLVNGFVDVIYQDVAQPDQIRIFVDNLKAFSTYGGWGLIAIKARSIDSTGDVHRIYDQQISLLDSAGLQIVERVELEPFEKDHIMVSVRVPEDFV